MFFIKNLYFGDASSINFLPENTNDENTQGSIFRKSIAPNFMIMDSKRSNFRSKRPKEFWLLAKL